MEKEIINVLNDRIELLNEQKKNLLYLQNDIEKNFNNEKEDLSDDIIDAYNISLKHYYTRWISLIASVSTTGLYALSKNDLLLYASFFSITFTILNEYFLRKESSRLKEDTYLIIYRTFIEQMDKDFSKVKDNELNKIKKEMDKINTAIEFMNNLTEEEKTKYLTYKMN